MLTTCSFDGISVGVGVDAVVGRYPHLTNGVGVLVIVNFVEYRSGKVQQSPAGL